jgi:hypothetical protein
MCISHLPSSLAEHIQLVTRPVWIGDDQTWPNDVEGSIDVHWIWVLEGKNMDAIFISKMAFHPLNTKKIGNLDKKANSKLSQCHT